jgi:hypothetical protein
VLTESVANDDWPTVVPKWATNADAKTAKDAKESLAALELPPDDLEKSLVAAAHHMMRVARTRAPMKASESLAVKKKVDSMRTRRQAMEEMRRLMLRS